MVAEYISYCYRKAQPYVGSSIAFLDPPRLDVRRANQYGTQQVVEVKELDELMDGGWWVSWIVDGGEGYKRGLVLDG